MTGAQTDPVHVPNYLCVVSRTLALAKPLLIRGSRDWDNLQAQPDAESLKHWNALRQIVDTFLVNRHLSLSPEKRERMVGALKFAHELAHDCDLTRSGDVPPVTECTCSTAEAIKELTLACLSADGVPCES